MSRRAMFSRIIHVVVLLSAAMAPAWVAVAMARRVAVARRMLRVRRGRMVVLGRCMTTSVTAIGAAGVAWVLRCAVMR